MNKYFTILIPVLVSAGAQGFIKFGAIHSNLFWIGFGYLLFAGSMFIWTKALSIVDLNFAYPFTSIGYALSAVSGWLFFSETIGFTKLLGIAVITLGAFICAYERQPAKAKV